MNDPFIQFEKSPQGVYVPVFSNQTNLDLLSPATSVGFSVFQKLVTLFGVFRIDVTSTGDFSFDMSLPSGLPARGANIPSAPGVTLYSYGVGVSSQGEGFFRVTGNTITNAVISGNTNSAVGAEYMPFVINYFTA